MYYIWLNKIHNSIFKFSFILDLMFFSTPGASTNLNPLLTVSILSKYLLLFVEVRTNFVNKLLFYSEAHNSDNFIFIEKILAILRFTL